MQIWKVVGINCTSQALKLGKVRMESKGPRDMQNSLELYVSLDELANYPIGAEFLSDLSPVVQETVTQ